ncbi:MAG: hypothetical protein Q9M31_05990 [Mariprofundus sp.]|nr:hypothetical protein [Mariprofundus sp.]
MRTIWRQLLFITLLLSPISAWAVDSYRFLHVSIDTPWFIFIFLFFLVFAPMILMAILHWRQALRDDPEEEDKS